MRYNKGVGIIISVGVGALVAAVHLKFGYTLANPRMVTQPWLISQGFIPYLHFADQKTPLLPQSLAWLSTLWDGDTVATMLMAYSFFIFATVFLTVLWIYQHGGLWAGVVASIFFLAWSGTFGYWAMYYDLVLGLLYVLVFMLLVRKQDRQSIWSMLLCGIIVGVAILIKQYAVFLILPLAYWLFLQMRTYGKLSLHTVRLVSAFSLGFALIIGTYLGYYYSSASTWNEFVYWTLTYNITSSYATQGHNLPTLNNIRQLLPALLLAGPFILGLITIPVEKRCLPRSTALWLLIFAAVAMALLYPRYSTRHLAAVAPFIQ